MSYQENQEDDKIFQEMQEFIKYLKQQTLSPEILPFKKDIFQSLREAVRDQNNRIKEYIKPQSDGETTNHEKNFKQLIYQSQTEKIAYLLKQYLRIRLRKIEKYAFYLVTKELAIKNLSPGEMEYLKNYSQLRYEHLREEVLKDCPKQIQHLGGVEMRFERSQMKPFQLQTQQTKIDLREPNLKEYCFALISENPDQVRFNDNIEVGNVTGNFVIPANEVIYTQYINVQKLVENGNAYLI